MLAVGSDSILRIWKDPCEGFNAVEEPNNPTVVPAKASLSSKLPVDLRAPVTLSPCGYTEYRGHTGVIEQVAWHPTQPFILATASVDKSVRFWDLRSSLKIVVN